MLFAESSILPPNSDIKGIAGKKDFAKERAATLKRAEKEIGSSLEANLIISLNDKKEKNRPELKYVWPLKKSAKPRLTCQK